MQGFNRHPLAVSVVASVALAGCFGGSSSSSDDNGDTADLSPVTAENERDVSIAAAESVGAAGDGPNDLAAFGDALEDANDDGAQSQSTQVQPANEPYCSDDDISINDDGSEVRYSVDDGTCTIDTGEGLVEVSGAYVFSGDNQWGDSRCDAPDVATEFLYGGDPEFVGEGTVDFRLEGGFGFRQATQMPADLPNGDYCFNFEYGATDEGFLLESDGRSFSLEPNAFKGILVEATVSNNELVSLNQEFYAEGVFELGDGEFYEVSFDQGVATRSEDDTDDDELNADDMQLGGQFCPDSGSMTVSGADGSEVVVTFGEDVEEDGAEVRVEGDSVAYYENCDDFYADDPFSGGGG